ncbi:MAG: hypothetical protein GY749_10215 [Desulfobacteraceae bacterium]|nr:hypothetical protein [Desulfobacteraceae bacterium]
MERTVISSRDVSVADFTVDSVDIRRNGNEPVPGVGICPWRPVCSSVLV